MKIIPAVTFLFFSLILLYLGKFLLLPLFIAVFLYIIIKSLSKDLRGLSLKFKINLNRILSIVLIFLFAIFLCYFSFKIFKINVNKVISNTSLYQQNLENITNYLSETFISKILSANQIFG